MTPKNNILFMDKKRTIAAFDFDGTITTRDSLLPFLFFTHGILQSLFYFFLLLPILVGFLLGFVKRQTAKEAILKKFYKNTFYKELKGKAEKYSSSKLHDLVRPEALERIHWHQNQGHCCVIISASVSLYLKPWGKSVGIEEVISSKLEVTEEGIITGKLQSSNCWGKEKVKRLEKLFGPKVNYTLYAYGDSQGDKPLLDIADYAFYRTMS